MLSWITGCFPGSYLQSASSGALTTDGVFLSSGCRYRASLPSCSYRVPYCQGGFHRCEAFDVRRENRPSFEKLIRSGVSPPVLREPQS